MKKKETPYLDLYIECMETGKLLGPSSGLCGSIPNKQEFLNLFEPNWEEIAKYNLYFGHWAVSANEDLSPTDRYYKFTTFRQTLVLFMAAINDEL